jgi:hypothetical protein
MGIEQIKYLPCNPQRSTCQNTEHHVMGIEQIPTILSVLSTDFVLSVVFTHENENE